jgi:hypothetical protein
VAIVEMTGTPQLTDGPGDWQLAAVAAF